MVTGREAYTELLLGPVCCMVVGKRVCTLKPKSVIDNSGMCIYSSAHRPRDLYKVKLQAF